MDELTRDFVVETREMLDAAGSSLVAWESEPGNALLLGEIFRFVHTVKGSCGFLDFKRIGALAHAAEDVLAAAREGRRHPDDRLVGAMLAIIDRIAVLTEALESGVVMPDEASDAMLIAALDEKAELTRAAEAAPRQTVNTIRLPVTLLEGMMNQVSDLVLARNDLARRVRAAGQDAELAASFTALTRVVGELRDSIGRARLQPIERLFRALPRLVRDTGQLLGKELALTVEGDDVEIDRVMIEALRDPLTHIVRNAIDHGLEVPERRRSAGKPAQGRLTVSARQSGNQVSITIADDGRGIDVPALVQKAVAAGIVSESAGAAMGREAAQLIFAPGLSTAAAVTEISGRGVGMDVVRANVERLGGTIHLDNRPGQGLAITVRVPLTLSILTCLSIELGGQRFALPRAHVEEVVATTSDAVRYQAIGDAHVATIRGELLSTVDLAGLLQIRTGAPRRLVVVSAAGAQYVLPVDDALEHEELVVRPLAPLVAASGLFAGQSLPDDGQPLLLLDAVGLAERAGLDRATTLREVAPLPVTPDQRATALTFVALDGSLQAVRTTEVERIEDVPREAFVTVGHQSFVRLDGALRPAVDVRDLPEDETIPVLRLLTPSGPVARPVRQVCDLVALGDVTPVEHPGYHGLFLIEGQPVPLLATERAAA